MKKNSLFVVMLVLGLPLACNIPSRIDPYSSFSFPEIEHLRLKGKVTDVRMPSRGFHGHGVIAVEIIESNIRFYDPRQKKDRYPMVIKENEAELYIYRHNIEIGDTLRIVTDSIHQISYRSGRMDGKQYQGGIALHEKRFFDYIEKKGLQKL